MAIRIFPKPDLSPTKQKENLEYDINRLQIRLESLEGEYTKKYAKLVEDFMAKESDIIRQTKELEGILAIKRAEKVELEKPLTMREGVVVLREAEADRLFNEIKDRENKLYKLEQELKTKENTIENFVDDLGERKLAVEKKEKLIEQKEQILKQKENEYLLKVDAQNEIYKQKDKEYQDKFAELDGIRIQIQATKENLEGREAILAKEQRLLKDRNELLLRNLQRK